ncbi:hypothetical protein [Planctomycetes bacterium K23_9]|uniref:hypothetical protein n=1 Tax=Stieleria marina TaxID=1930275 RepID=UPI0011A440ED
MPLGSCTCSSPSARAIVAAQAALKTLRESSCPHAVAAKLLVGVRSILRHRLKLSVDVAIALTPSGTDVEILALALVGGNDDRKIVNVVVGAGEVGSGTIRAAGGLHSDQIVPRGKASVVGHAVNESLAARTTVVPISVRSGSGEILSPIEIDDRVSQAVIDAVSQGSRVLVHLVAHSKTGVHAPTLGLIQRLTKAMGNDVSVVVDAAQARLAPSAYQSALDRGLMVFLTGSKFFGGPPFAGALLIPPALRPNNFSGLDGLENYLGREDFPVTWERVRSSCDEWLNVGSLLRWVAAASEIDAYFRVPDHVRKRIAVAFNQAIQERFMGLSNVKLVRSFQSVDHGSYLRPIESTPTVFAVEMMDQRGHRLGRDSLKELHGQLNVTGEDRFHLGQPVAIGRDRYALRIALGAPLVTQIANGTNDDSTLQHRIAKFQNQLGTLSQRMTELSRSTLEVGS